MKIIKLKWVYNKDGDQCHDITNDPINFLSEYKTYICKVKKGYRINGGLWESSGKVKTLKEAKRKVQSDFESYVTKHFFEEEKKK